MSTLLTDAPPAAAVPAAAVVDPAVAAAAPAAGAPPPGAGNVVQGADGRWMIPEEFRTHESVRKFADDKHTLDTSVLLKSYINLEGQMGRDKIPLPKSDEDWENAYKALGRPEAAEKYEVKRPENLPEGMTYDEAGEKHLRNIAFQNGWNQKQFGAAYEALFKHNTEMQAGWQNVVKEQRSTAEANLKREWGAAYDQNLGVAKAAMLEYADPDLVEHLNTSGLGNDPRLVKVFARIGKELMGDAKLKGAGAPSGTMTPAEVTAKIQKFRTDNHAALYDADHIDHKRLVAELEGLHKMQVPQR